MLRFVTPLLILQIFCIYHVYKNKREYWWIWVILLFPLIGCGIYLYKTFYSKRNIQNIAEEVKSTINTNYTITKLEKELEFSDTVENKTKVADEYSRRGNYERAFELYESCLKGVFANDQDLILKLTRVSYLKEDYANTVQFGERIKQDRDFNKSEEKIALAWSYHHLGDSPKAESLFAEMNVQFSNYKSRVDFIQFLIETNNNQKAKEIAESVISEINAMEGSERRSKRNFLSQIKGLNL